MSRGPVTTLAGVCESVRYGYTASASQEPCGPRFLRITDIVPESLNWETVPYCEVTDEDKERFALAVGDIVVARTGATVGYAKLIREPEDAVFASYLVRFRVDPSRADPAFVGRLVESNLYKAYVQSRIGGAAQPNASAPVLGSFEFALPSKHSQSRIAEMLSAYDELMENNRRRMGLLESAARLLYQEWFVRLRFPGHEHTPTTHGLPQGWTTYALDDICLVGRGASPRPIADFMGGEVPWFRIADATASESPYIFHTAEHVTDDGAKKSIILEPGALILSNSATCGIPNFTGVRGCIHDGWLHFANLKRISLQFLYCYFHDKRDELVSSVSDGSTQKNLNTAAVGRLKVVLPPQDVLLAQFDQSVGPMFKMIFNLAQQNISLRAARDLLLPRLMSGEIEV